MGLYERCGPKLVGKISCQIIMGVKKSEIILELEKSNESLEWSMRTVGKGVNQYQVKGLLCYTEGSDELRGHCREQKRPYVSKVPSECVF